MSPSPSLAADDERYRAAIDPINPQNHRVLHLV
jgi:hypothetical protein